MTPQTRPLFEAYGNTLHLKINDHDDLNAVLQLNEALWIATTAPLATLKIDKTFLSLLDTDSDGRLRAEEIKDGIRFLNKHLTDYSAIKDHTLRLSLGAINRETALGKRMHSSALKVLSRLDISSQFIELEQVRQIKAEVLEGGLDQAGIVLREAAESEDIRQFMGDLLRTVGGREHPGGQHGVDINSLERFTQECHRYVEWQLEAGEIDGESATPTLPLGKQSAKGYGLFHSLEKKFVQHFLLCDIKRLNPELLSRALEIPEANVALNLINIEDAEAYLKNAPLSLLGDNDSLDLDGQINPYFEGMIKELREQVIWPLMGEDTKTIDKKDFHKLQDIFHPFVQWSDRMPEVRVNSLSAHTAQNYVTSPYYRQTLEELIEKSHRTAFVLDNIKELERLILYQAYMLPLVNSFVSFPKLYRADDRALFEEGTLIMDGRHFTLAIQVEDRKHHIETCKSSNIFVIYCELYGKDNTRMFEIAVPITSGNRGNIHLHKWGIFNDRYGDEFHARVVDIVENPISVSEAMIEPFNRISQAFVSRLEEFSSKAEQRLFLKGEKAKKNEDKSGPSPGMLAGGGFAVAAIGSSFAFVTKTLAALSIKTVLIAVFVLVCLIAIPTGIAAYYKLSRRDLSTILEGSGWGINARMKLTSAQADCFTFRPVHRKEKP